MHRPYRFIANIPVDPGFPAFARMCREHGQPFTILSDGLDRVTYGVMRRLGLSVPIRSNRLESLDDGRWRLGFPHADAGCMTMAGNCKCAGMEAMRGDYGRPPALICYGRSDFCGAGAATHVFAKGRLATHCRDHGIAHQPFAGFQDLTPVFADWLNRHFRPAVAAE
ncbi:hypothetical protein [Niveispirillum cyanobacteriorum]|uniref:Uncharacterized protein n=1 Tax=Niveispirillum cyanobacteriorum TaxID=1612173 RepID=A0A2K9NHN0_9PROT|nr:hypothetical protein [Niveispirillum cyanobacteriorum]AUN32583.1 hypothetical protein C0V82_19805 [Niveispirillum cyanobacteriorum]